MPKYRQNMWRIYVRGFQKFLSNKKMFEWMFSAAFPKSKHDYSQRISSVFSVFFNQIIFLIRIYHAVQTLGTTYVDDDIINLDRIYYV